MKYVLNSQYALRGFLNGRQQTLLHLGSKRRIPLEGPIAAVLRMCDGEKDFDDYRAFPFYGQIVKMALKKGWVREAEAGQRLSDEQRYTETDRRNIDSVQWSVTGRCNAKCRHCFIASSQKRHRDLGTDEMLLILDRLAERDILDIEITGGEPLVRPDLPALLKAMAERRMRLTGLVTNGFLLTERTLDLFKEYGMRPDIQISFDGTGCHDWLRGVDGAEMMTLKAMDHCRKKDFPFSLVMSVHGGNLHSVPETVKLAVSKGAAMIRISRVDPTADGYQERNGIRLLTVDELTGACLSYLPAFVKERPAIMIQFVSLFEFNGKEPEKYRIIPTERCCADPERYRICRATEHTFYISDEGRVLPCMLIGGTPFERECLSLREHSVDECLNAPAYKRFTELTAADVSRHNPECAGCEFLKYCGGGCRAVPLSENGSLYGMNRKRCEFFGNRWHEKFKDVMDRCLNG